MILISVKISVHYYPHIIELDVQLYISWNATAGKSYMVHHILSCGWFWVYNVFQVPIKRNLDLTSLEIYDTMILAHRVLFIYLGMWDLN